jgi:hypothetical protein
MPKAFMKDIKFNVVGSTMKVVASSKVNIEKDLEQDNNQEHKTIAELLDEQKTKQETTDK